MYNKVKRERWRKVVGTPGYEVSNLGNVRGLDRKVRCAFGATRRIPGKALRTKLSRGAPEVTLQHGGARRCVRVHRLVAEAWVPNPERLPFVTHLNGDKTDNRAENLAWVRPPRRKAKPARDATLNADEQWLRRFRELRRKATDAEVAVSFRALWRREEDGET